MQKSVYLYPPITKEGVNPYCRNYKKCLSEYFELRDKENKIPILKTWHLLRYSFNTDIFIMNWIESVGHLRFGILQIVITLISLLIIKVRKRKIIWMLHNIRPHEGDSWSSNMMKKVMFKYSNYIITHSKEAQLCATKHACCDVKYICHPINTTNYNNLKESVPASDIFIWGWINPYKGIPEFLENCKEQLKNKKIIIIGKCYDNNLISKIQVHLNDDIIYLNKKASFEEIASYVRNSRYVVFPYIGESISSSGVLLDTIAMGGNPIGPNRAAFKDLHDEGMCFVYNDYEEIIDIISSNRKIQNEERERFIKKNSWYELAILINNLMKE